MADKNIIEDLEMRIQGNSKSLVFARLADLYLEEGKADEAQQICEEGIRQNPDYITGFYILAKIHLKKENFSEAEEALKKVISHDNEYLSAHKLLGDLMLQMGFENKAAQHYKEMLRIDPFDEATDGLLKSLGDTGIDLDEMADEEDRSSIRSAPASIAASNDWIHEINEVFPDEEESAPVAEATEDPLSAGSDEIDAMFDVLEEKPKPHRKQPKPSLKEDSFDDALDQLTEADFAEEKPSLEDSREKSFDEEIGLTDDAPLGNEIDISDALDSFSAETGVSTGEDSFDDDSPNISDTPSFVNLGDMTDEEDLLKTKDQDLADLISFEKQEEPGLDEDAIAFDDTPINPNELIQNIPDLEETESAAGDWEDAFTFENLDTIEDKSEEGIAGIPELPVEDVEEEEVSDWKIEPKPASSGSVEDDAFVFDSFEEPQLGDKSEAGGEDLTWDAFASGETDSLETPLADDEPMQSVEELPEITNETESIEDIGISIPAQDSGTDFSEDAFIFEPPDESPAAIETTEEVEEDLDTNLAFSSELSFEESSPIQPELEEEPVGLSAGEESPDDDLNFPSQFEDLTFGTPKAEEPSEPTLTQAEEEPSFDLDTDIFDKTTEEPQKSKLPPIDFNNGDFKDVFEDSEDQFDANSQTLTLSPNSAFTETTGFRNLEKESESDEPYFEEDSRELADIVRDAEQPPQVPERDAMTPAPKKPLQPESSEGEAEGEIIPHKIVTPTLGEIYAAQGQFAKAIEIYEELLSQSPGEIKYRNKIDELKQKLNESL